MESAASWRPSRASGRSTGFSACSTSRSARGHAELRTSESEARHQRQFAAGVGPRRQCVNGAAPGREMEDGIRLCQRLPEVTYPGDPARPQRVTSNRVPARHPGNGPKIRDRPGAASCPGDARLTSFDLGLISCQQSRAPAVNSDPFANFWALRPVSPPCQDGAVIS